VHLLLDRIGVTAKAGLDAIQLREKDLTAHALVELGRRAVQIVQQANASNPLKPHTRLLINSRVDVAITSGADGVHLRSNDTSAADARAIFLHATGRQPLVGVSCHSVQEVELAESQGADFAVFGPVFGKSSALQQTHEGESASGDAARCISTTQSGGTNLRGTAGALSSTELFELEAVCRRQRTARPAMPVLALGSIEMGNAAECLRAGAGGVGGIRLFQQGNATEVVSYLRGLDLRPMGGMFANPVK